MSNRKKFHKKMEAEARSLWQSNNWPAAYRAKCARARIDAKNMEAAKETK